MDTEIVSREGLRQRIVSEAQKLAGKLNEEIEKGNDTQAFMLATLLAAFKDYIDIFLTVTFIGFIPGANFTVGLFLTSFLFFFMLSKGWFLKTRIKIWFWILGLVIDGFPAVSAFPMNTMLVLYAWRLARKRRDRAEVKLRDLGKLTDREVSRLNSDISLLETTA